MKRILFVSTVLISGLSCWRSENYSADLSTPEKTLKSYYEVFKTSGFEYQKKTVLSSIESIGKERFDTKVINEQAERMFEQRWKK